MTALGILFRHGVRERMANTRRVLLSGAVLLIPLVLGTVEGSPRLPGVLPAIWLSLILGAGLIGQDTASGVLQLVLARPVVRLHYVLARWLAVGGMAGAGAVIQTLGLAAIMVVRRQPLHAGELTLALGTQVLAALGIAAVLAMFSAMASGLGDILIWVLVLLLGQVVQLVGQARQWEWMARIGAEMMAAMLPTVASDAAGAGGWPYALLRWTSTVVLALAVATAVLNRKELSYGAA